MVSVTMVTTGMKSYSRIIVFPSAAGDLESKLVPTLPRSTLLLTVESLSTPALVEVESTIPSFATATRQCLLLTFWESKRVMAHSPTNIYLLEIDRRQLLVT